MKGHKCITLSGVHVFNTHVEMEKGYNEHMRVGLHLLFVTCNVNFFLTIHHFWVTEI